MFYIFNINSANFTFESNKLFLRSVKKSISSKIKSQIKIISEYF